MPYRRIDIPQDLLDRMTENKKDYGVSMQDFIIKAIRDSFEELDAAKEFNRQWKEKRAQMRIDHTKPKS